MVDFAHVVDITWHAQVARLGKEGAASKALATKVSAEKVNPEIRARRPGTCDPKSRTRNPEPETRSQKPRTLYPESQTLPQEALQEKHSALAASAAKAILLQHTLHLLNLLFCHLLRGPGFRVQGQGSGFRVQGQGSGFRV